MTWVQIQAPTNFLQDRESNTDFPKCLSLLEERLSKSCFIYNAVKISPRFPQHSKIHYVTLGPDSGIGKESWIIMTHFTEDIGQNILISGPHSGISSSEKVTLLQLFSNCPSFILNWEEPHWFVALEPELARVITEIGVEVKGHNIGVYPDTLVYMDKRDIAIKDRLDTELEQTSRCRPDLEIRPLDPIQGSEFITSTWKFASSQTYLPVGRYLERNESAGIFVTRGKDKRPRSGLLLSGMGLMAMLHTLEEERGKGYAKLGIQRLSRDLLAQGLYPAATIERRNKASLRVFDSLGFKRGGRLVWITCSCDSNQELKSLRNG